jgi:SlyX protein
MDPDDIDRRLTDLEIKASYTEDTLDALNAVVVRQQEQIDLLVRELKRLRDEGHAKDAGASPGGTGTASSPSPADERPPHY